LSFPSQAGTGPQDESEADGGQEQEKERKTNRRRRLAPLRACGPRGADREENGQASCTVRPTSAARPGDQRSSAVTAASAPQHDRAPGLPPRTPRLWARPPLVFDHPAAWRGTRQEFPVHPVSNGDSPHTNTMPSMPRVKITTGGRCNSPGWARIRGWPAECTCPPLRPKRDCSRRPTSTGESAGERTREVTLDPGASTDTPARRQGPGGSLPGPGAGHPLQPAGGDPEVGIWIIHQKALSHRGGGFLANGFASRQASLAKHDDLGRSGGLSPGCDQPPFVKIPTGTSRVPLLE